MVEKKVSASNASKISPSFSRKNSTAKKSIPIPVENDDTVCVALNRPNGIYFRMPDGRKVELNGNGHSLAGRNKGVLPVGTYGLTLIKREDWDHILKNFGGMKLFKNGLCFAADKRDDAEKEAESRNDLRNGLEPVNPDRAQTKEAIEE